MADSWIVETLDDRVDREIEELPVDIRAGLVRISQLIEDVGLDKVREPYVKHIEGPIWEMRPRGRSGIGRAFYVTHLGKRVIILRAFQKKSQATPRREIKLAFARLADLDRQDRTR
jgi:phage-related protein